MNVLLAPFLFELGELNAVNCFARFLCGVCPTYVQPDLRGVHVAIEVGRFRFSIYFRFSIDCFNWLILNCTLF